MKSRQYTIRKVSPALDKALRQRAKTTGKSLNTVVLDALNREAGVAGRATPKLHHDLDWLFGSNTMDQKEFDDAMKWLDSAPREIEVDLP